VRQHTATRVCSADDCWQEVTSHAHVMTSEWSADRKEDCPASRSTVTRCCLESSSCHRKWNLLSTYSSPDVDVGSSPWTSSASQQSSWLGVKMTKSPLQGPLWRWLLQGPRVHFVCGCVDRLRTLKIRYTFQFDFQKSNAPQYS